MCDRTYVLKREAENFGAILDSRRLLRRLARLLSLLSPNLIHIELRMDVSLAYLSDTELLWIYNALTGPSGLFSRSCQL